MVRRRIGGTRRKTAKKTTHRRKRRRVSGINLGGIAMDVLGLVGGAVIAREGANIILKEFPGASPLLIGAGQIAAGIFLPRFVKSQLGKDLGNGMIAFGGQVLAVNLGVISGVPNTISYPIGGTNRLTAIAGTPYLAAVAGAPPRVANPRPGTRSFSNTM